MTKLHTQTAKQFFSIRIKAEKYVTVIDKIGYGKIV